MSRVCVIPAPRCHHDGSPVQLHHVLGRGADGKYLQPEIVLPLCEPDDHQGGIHRLLQVAKIDGPMPDTDGLRVGRVGETLRWFGWPRVGSITVPCDLLWDMGDVLCGLGRDLRQVEGVER